MVTDIVSRFDSWREVFRLLSPWRPLPSTQRTERLMTLAIEQSRIKQDNQNGRNTRWLENSGVEHLFFVQAQMLGEERRIIGGDLQLIHLYGVGHLMANCVNLLKLGFSAPYLGMRGGIHDTGETAYAIGKGPAEMFAQSVAEWQPQSECESRLSIIQSGWNLTDDPTLRGQKRLDAQRERSRTFDVCDAYDRFYDKWHNAAEDRFNIERDRATPKQAQDSATQAARRWPIVEVLGIPNEEKAQYLQLVAVLADLAKRPKVEPQQATLLDFRT